MKATTVFFTSMVLLFALSSCGKPDEDKLLETAETRGHIISAVITHDHYLHEFMDSMMHNPQARTMMMSKDGMMKSMIKEDSAMRNSMMGEMMSLMEKDSMMCAGMMQMMMGNPRIAKQMKKATEGTQDKLDHTKHHPPVDEIKKKDESEHKH